MAIIVFAVIAAIGFYYLRARSTIRVPVGKKEASPYADTVTSKADYKFRNPIGGFYIGVHMAEEVLVLRGAARKQLICDFSRAVIFTDVRGARIFRDDYFLGMNGEGIEIEIDDLETPVIRIVMSRKLQSAWLARVSQICKMRRY